MSTKLIIQDVDVSYEQAPVLADISIELRQGELVSLLGASGSGKTTLFNVIAGLNPPDAG